MAYKRSFLTQYWKTTRRTIPYVQTGLGFETDVWKNGFIGLEGGLVYNLRTDLSQYYRLSKRWEKTARLRAGVRF